MATNPSPRLISVVLSLIVLVMAWGLSFFGAGLILDSTTADLFPIGVAKLLAGLVLFLMATALAFSLPIRPPRQKP